MREEQSSSALARPRLVRPRLPWVGWPNLKIGAITLALVTYAIFISTASADTCTVDVVLPTGQTETFVVDADSATPPSQMVPAGVQYQSVSATCAPGTTMTTASSTQPHLIDLTGDLRFGPAADSLGALIVYDGTGVPVGRYVDDTVPNQAAVIEEEHAAGIQLIIAGIPPGTPHLRYPGALNAQEWYPYNSGSPAANWGPMPKAQAYVIQWSFSLAGPPPTQRQRMRLLREARRRHPFMIIGY